MEMHILITLQPEIALWLVGREVVEDDVDLSVRIVGHHLVHEVEELQATASLKGEGISSFNRGPRESVFSCSISPAKSSCE